MARLWTVCWLGFALTGCSDDPSGDDGPQGCVEIAPDALTTCVGAYSAAVASCYADNNAPCADGDGATVAALDALQASVEGNCADGEHTDLSVAALNGLTM